jgi:uncharacterized protein (TIGR03083 family)
LDRSSCIASSIRLVSRELSAVVDALDATWSSLRSVCDELTSEEWLLPTECPGWTVRDQVAHVASIEHRLLGRPELSHELPDNLPYVRNDWGRRMELGVDPRRRLAVDDLLAEFDDVTRERLAYLRSAPLDPQTLVIGVLGREMPLVRMLAVRVFDSWTHEQDVRRAVGRPGNLNGPGAAVSRDYIVQSLPYVVAKKAGAVPGTVMSFDIDGPLTVTTTVAVGDDGRGVLRDMSAPPAPAAPTAHLATDWETFARLSAGRIEPLHATVVVDGDRELAERVLTAMAITP